MIFGFIGKHYFLSNFHPCRLRYKGRSYPSVEHAFQAQKAMSESEQSRIANAKTPGDAKRLGRAVKCRSDWDQVKLQVMLDLVRIKFARPDLARLLIKTHGHDLVEANTWHDRFWGTTMTGIGQNHLGKILMQVRGEISELTSMTPDITM